MQWSKVKSILIAILFLVDVFLFGVLAVKWVSEQNRQRDMSKSLQTVLAKNGISTGESNLICKAMIPQLIVDRSRTEELKMAHALIGDDAERIDGENGIKLISDNGNAEFSDNGEINIQFTPSDYKKPSKSDVKESAKEIIEDCGINHSSIEWSVKDYTASLSFKTAGYEVFNRQLKIKFSDDYIAISGMWTFSEPYATRNNLYSEYDSMDSLIWFAQQKKANIIYSVEAGLLISNISANQIQLSPVWQVKTDKGLFYIDPIKNELV